MTPASVNKILWIKKQWHLKANPFPSQAIALLGGEDLRENGLLFDPPSRRTSSRKPPRSSCSAPPTADSSSGSCGRSSHGIGG